MSRTPRVIIEGRTYEVVSRAREGLPLPPTAVTRELLKGIIARTQRDDKVILCNFTFMNNHMHSHQIPREAEKFPRFYGEIQKKITDSVRALLGRQSLRLWEDRASVILLAELEDCIQRLIYIFCNPAKAALVDSITDYPGLSSWNAFTTCEASVDATVSMEVNWYPVAAIPTLPASKRLTPEQDSQALNQLRSSERSVPCTLSIQPFAWLKQFGITEKREIEAIRKRIIDAVFEAESKIREQRRREGKAAIGARVLAAQPYMKPHIPKKRERKIFLICTDRTLRIKLIQHFKTIFEECKRAHQRLKRGLAASWPPGTFIPWMPPQECACLDCFP